MTGTHRRSRRVARSTLPSLIRNATIVTMNDRARHRRGDGVGPRRPDRRVGAEPGGAARHASSTRAAPISCPASSRPTSISARRCSAATPTTCRCSSGCAAASGRWKRRTRPRRCAPRRGSPPPSCCSAARPPRLTMETVHDTDVVFEALDEMGLRAVVGKCMMDSRPRSAGAAAGADARVDRRERRAAQAVGRRARTAGCAPRSRRASPCRARASCSRRSPTLSARDRVDRPHARVRESATRSKSCAGCRAA